MAKWRLTLGQETKCCGFKKAVVSTMIWQKFELFSLVQGHEQKDMRGETSANGWCLSIREVLGAAVEKK